MPVKKKKSASLELTAEGAAPGASKAPTVQSNGKGDLTTETVRSGKRGTTQKYNTETEALKEVEELSAEFKKIKESDKRAEQQYWDALDSEFWIAVTFQNREQKEEFLRKARIIQYGDKYLDGMLVAKALGIELTTPVPPIRKHKKPEKRLIELSMEG